MPYTPSLDFIDIALLEAAAVHCYWDQKKRYIEEGNHISTLNYRQRKLKKLQLLNQACTLSAHGFSFLGQYKRLSLKTPVISSHALNFKSRVFNPPTKTWLKLNGWSSFRFARSKSYRAQYICVKTNVGFQLVGSTLLVYVPKVLGPNPRANCAEAGRIACEAVEELRKRGWQLDEPIPAKRGFHHVFTFLSPIAKAVFRKSGRIEVMGITVDNSCRDGGEFEVHDEEKAEELLSAIADLPAMQKKVNEYEKRFSAIESTLQLTTDALKLGRQSE